MTLFYPHVAKIFIRNLSSCVVCLILCNNFILLYCLIVLSYYTFILGLQVLLYICLFLYISMSCNFTYVSINITYLLKRCVWCESQLSGVLRITMKPLVSRLPVIAILTVHFLEQPVSTGSSTY